MKKFDGIIRKIDSQYIGEDCVQVMVPYKESLIVFDENGVLYAHKEGQKVRKNKYLEDERRNQFSYSNIPIHYRKVNLFDKMHYANQLLDFEKPYICITDKGMFQIFIAKEDDEAFLVHTNMQVNNENVAFGYGYVDCDYLAKLLEEKITDTERKFVVYPTGIFNPLIANDNDIRKGALVVKTDENGMNIQYVKANIAYIDHNYKCIYKADIVDIKFQDYKPELLNSLIKKSKLKEPKISLRLNPNVTREQLQ